MVENFFEADTNFSQSFLLFVFFSIRAFPHWNGSPGVQVHSYHNIDLFRVFKVRRDKSSNFLFYFVGRGVELTLQTVLSLEMGHHIFSSAPDYSPCGHNSCTLVKLNGVVF